MKTSVIIVLIMAAPLISCAKEKALAGPVDPGHGLEAAFLGSWQVARPDEEGVIVNVPKASCDAVVTITALGTDIIAYKSPKAETATTFNLMEFEGRITWIPKQGTTSISERKDADTFWLYSVSPMGKADWDNPMAYTRCPAA